MDLRESLARDGFAIVPDVLAPGAIERLAAELDRGGDRIRTRAGLTYGSRTVPRGGAVLMHLLLLHASGVATRPSRRRVLHVEYAAALLPHGLAWAVE